MLHTTAHLAVIALRLLLLRGSCFDFPGLSRFCPLHSRTPYWRIRALPALLVLICVRFDCGSLACWGFGRGAPGCNRAWLFRPASPSVLLPSRPSSLLT